MSEMQVKLMQMKRAYEVGLRDTRIVRCRLVLGKIGK